MSSIHDVTSSVQLRACNSHACSNVGTAYSSWGLIEYLRDKDSTYMEPRVEKLINRAEKMPKDNMFSRDNFYEKQPAKGG